MSDDGHNVGVGNLNPQTTDRPQNVTARVESYSPEPFLDIEQVRDTLLRLTGQIEALTAQRQAATQPSQKQIVETKEPKAAEVVPFDGKERRKLKFFLGQCEATFALQASRFPSDRTKILFVGQHMSDRAANWFSSRYLAHLASQPDKFQNYTTFKTDVIANWGDPDVTKTAIRELKRLEQGRRSASDYAASFLEYSEDSGYNDKALIEQFRSHLKEAVKDDLARMENEPTTLEEFIKSAIKIDNRIWDREQERRSKLGNVTQHHTTPVYSSSKALYQSKSNEAPKSKPVLPIDPNTKKLLPEERQRRLDLGLCLRCGEKGHIATNCPRKQTTFKRTTQTTTETSSEN